MNSDRIRFKTLDGLEIPAVTRDEMQLVDRIAVEEFQLGILQMMENAGRDLAQLAMECLDTQPGSVWVLAGSGGNGGGGLCCARHLRNRGIKLKILLSKPGTDLRGEVKTQLEILIASGAEVSTFEEVTQQSVQPVLIIDALIGYNLIGPPRGDVAKLIDLANRSGAPILSLDIPSGMNATNGSTPGVVVNATTTLTLALPKTGLLDYSGSLYLGDIGIPPELYRQLGFEPPPFPEGAFVVPLRPI